MAETIVDDTLEQERLGAILESLLFAAGEPVTLAQLANALETVPREEIRRALGEMAKAYVSAGRGVVLEEIAGGYQLRTRKNHAPYIRRLLASRPPRLSRPLLETLAIVAYRQPVTRPEIEQLRGVDSGGVLDTLIERSLISLAGRKEAPGRPIMYATTPEFLQLFGLKDLEGLPDLEEFRALENIRGAEPGVSTPAGKSLAAQGQSDATASEDSAAEESEFAKQGSDTSGSASARADRTATESPPTAGDPANSAAGRLPKD